MNGQFTRHANLVEAPTSKLSSSVLKRFPWFPMSRQPRCITFHAAAA